MAASIKIFSTLPWLPSFEKGARLCEVFIHNLCVRRATGHDTQWECRGVTYVVCPNITLINFNFKSVQLTKNRKLSSSNRN